MSRRAEIERNTKETKIKIALELDGTGKAELHSGIGFFDHMLDGFARHGLFDLTVDVDGDLDVDCHHTVEDTGIVLGNAIREAVGDKKGIRRYGSCILPMDEALVLCAVDLSGRPYYVSDASFSAPMIGDLDTETISEFFYAVSYSAAINLHFKVFSGSNSHHICEAMFKAFAKALDAAIDGDSRVLIVGAGLIGLKCAEGISDKVKSITVVDLANRILPSILDVEGSEIVKEHIEEHGVEFILEDSVAEFKDGVATLNSGKTVEYDVVVIAVGVRPNTSLVSEAGGEVNRGIATDLKCQTTISDVYAAGDCAESLNSATGEHQVLALLPNAYMQGHAAGVNMAGGEELYDKAIPMNSIGFWGLHVITAGDYSGEEIVTREGSKYKKLVVSDNLLKGFILIDNIERAGIYTRLVRDKIALDEIDFEAIAENPGEMAFSRAVRKEDLGGVKQ